MPVVFGNVAAYAKVNATTHALYSRMLTLEMKRTLIQTQDFDALLNVLSDTVYGLYLQIERRLLTPRRTVYQLRWYLADSYEKLIRLTPDPACEFLIQLWRLYEVDNLKATLRGIAAGASWDQVRHLLSPMVKHITLTMDDMERMLQAGDMARAIERLQGTPYYDTLVHALARYQTEHTVFPLEVALDLDYRRSVWQNIDQFTGLDHEKALRLVGTTMDVDNLLWAIRYRVYHHLSEQEIINYTLSAHYQVKDQDIRAIARGEDIGQVVKRVYPALAALGQIPDLSETQDQATLSKGLAMLEQALNRYLIRLCRATFIGNPFHVGIPVAYLLLTEYEIQELTAIVEAKASQLPAEVLTSMVEV